MTDPQEAPEDKRFSGTICISVYVKVEEITGNNAGEVAEEAVTGLQDNLRNHPQYDHIELESHDLWQVNREPDFWDKVDDAYDAKKHER